MEEIRLYDSPFKVMAVVVIVLIWTEKKLAILGVC